MKSSEQQLALRNINNHQIDLISEICLNFLNSNIKTSYSKLNLLAKFRNYLHKLSSKSISHKLKRNILSSLQGLYILKLLLPVSLQALNILLSSLE